MLHPPEALCGLARWAAAVGIAFVLIAAPADAQTTALFLDSQQGDSVGGGVQRTYTPADGTFRATSPSPGSGSRAGINVSVTAPSFAFWWFLDFAAAEGTPLQVGSYRNATRYPFTPFPAMDVHGNGNGCNQLTGRFWVREAVYAIDGSVVRFAVDFEQHCNDAAPGLFGALRYNSTISTLVPFDGAYPSYRLRIDPPQHGVVTGAGLDCAIFGPACEVQFPAPATATLIATPDPGYFFAGWAGACHGSRTISINVNTEKLCSARFSPLNVNQPATILMLNSQQGDFVGQGRRQIYNDANSRWRIRSWRNGNGVELLLDSAGDLLIPRWYMLFSAPTAMLLTPGTYNNARRFSTDTLPGLDVVGYGGCSQSNGSFIVHEVGIVGGVVTKLAVDFELACERAVMPPRPLRGSLRFNSLVPPRPTLAITTTGSGAKVTLAPPNVDCVGLCAENYSPGTSVVLTPTPSPGWTLSSWSGDPDCADGMVTMVAPMACHATFVSATVSAVAVTPSSGSGASQTFTFEYSDSLGASDLATAWVWFTASNAPGAWVNSCFMYYQPATNTLRLLNDAGSAYLSGTLGSSGMLSNNQCSVSLAASSRTAIGTRLTLNLAMRFWGGFSGAKNIYMDGVSMAGANSGWPDRGDWMVPTIPMGVTADSVTPNAGSGANQTFSFRYSDTFGALDLSTVWVWFSESKNPGAWINSCFIYYQPSTNRLNLLNDAGNAYTSGAFGSSTSLRNSQCSVSLAGSSASTDAETLTLNLALSFPGTTFNGLKQIYADGVSSNAVSSGWPDLGEWTIPAPSVTAVSVNPNAGRGGSQTFTFEFSDGRGASDLATAWVWFTPTFTTNGGAFLNTCFFYYRRSTNTVHLLNDGATAYLAGTVGAGASVRNSQCSLASAASSAVANGNTLTVTVPIEFNPATFSGPRNVFIDAVANDGASSGWPDRGDWSVPGQSVSAVSVSPSVGVGTDRTFAFEYSAAAGTNVIATAWVWFTPAFSLNQTAFTNSCFMYYVPQTNTLNLLNSTANGYTSGFVGSAGTLQNGQCLINLGTSSTALNGTTLTLTLGIAFSSWTFSGGKNIYIDAVGLDGSSSGWPDRGDWFVPPSALSSSITNEGGVRPDRANSTVPYGASCALRCSHRSSGTSPGSGSGSYDLRHSTLR